MTATQVPSIPAQADKSYALGITAQYLSITVDELQLRIGAGEVATVRDGRGRLFVSGAEILRLQGSASNS